MRLYGYWRSSSSWRVRIGCAYKGLSWDQVDVDLRQDEQHGFAFRDLNALAQVPVMEFDGGRRLTQSVAILEYLESRFPNPPLLPASGWDQARVREAVECVNSGIQPLQNFNLLKQVEALGADRNLWARDVISTGLDALERLGAAETGPFLIGSTVTLADVALVPQLYNARRFQCDLSRWPGLLRAEEEALKLEAFAQTHPDRQVQVQQIPKTERS